MAPESEGNVLEGREVRKEQVVLKDDADRPFLRRDMDVVDRVLEHDTVEGDPPGTDLDQAADGTKERRFSRPIGADQSDDLAAFYLERDPLQRPDVAVASVDVQNLKHC